MSDIVERPVRESLGPCEDCGQRVVQFVGNPRDRLPERGQLLCLKELVVKIARLILELLPLADVTHERFDSDHAVRRRGLGAGRDFDPHGGIVHAAQPEQIVCHRAVAAQSIDERGPGLRIDESSGIERTHVGLGHLRGMSEDQFEMGIGRNRDRLGRSRADRCTRPRARPRTGARMLRREAPRSGAGRFPESAEGTSWRLYGGRTASPVAANRREAAARINVMSDVSIARSVPVPIAMTMSARRARRRR